MSVVKSTTIYHLQTVLLTSFLHEMFCLEILKAFNNHEIISLRIFFLLYFVQSTIWQTRFIFRKKGKERSQIQHLRRGYYLAYHIQQLVESTYEDKSIYSLALLDVLLSR